MRCLSVKILLLMIFVQDRKCSSKFVFNESSTSFSRRKANGLMILMKEIEMVFCRYPQVFPSVTSSGYLTYQICTSVA